MKFNKALLFSLIISSLFSKGLYAQDNLPKDKPGTAVFVMSAENNSNIKVTTDYIEEESNYLNIDMKIPVMDNFKSKRFQRKLNKSIKKKLLCIKSSIERDSKRICPKYPYELVSNYNIKSNGDIFSLEITVYDYRGGAHGMTTNSYYNVDTINNKLISLDDYMINYNNDYSDYKEKIDQNIKDQIKERKSKGEVFFDDEQGFIGIKKDQSFYINDNKDLVIVFGLYEIAPYAEGIIEFTIPNEIFID